MKMLTRRETRLRDKIAMTVIWATHPSHMGIRSLEDKKSDDFIELLVDTAYRIADAAIERRKR